MLKRAFGFFFCLVFFMGLAPQVLAAESEEISVDSIYVDDVLIPDATSTLYNDTVYISLFHVAAALRPSLTLTWNGNEMLLTDDGLSLSAKPDNCYLKANDRYLYIPGGVKVDQNRTLLVPLDTLANVFGASVSRIDSNIQVSSSSSLLTSGADFYDSAAVDLLARVITNESGNQPMDGKIAVGNVILNRVNSSVFPNTLSEVIYQPGQFPGTTKNPPNSESVIAAKLCLEGAVVLDNAYWFSGSSVSCWASRNKNLVATIGGHAFYG